MKIDDLLNEYQKYRAAGLSLPRKIRLTPEEIEHIKARTRPSSGNPPWPASAFLGVPVEVCDAQTIADLGRFEDA